MSAQDDEEDADAEQAYTQAKLTGPTCWVTLPEEYWPASWKNIVNPVVPLEYALYGHPDAGTCWEFKSHNHLVNQGFVQIESSNSLFWHPVHKTFLMVYVDDFKMSGPTKSLSKAWSEILYDAVANPDGIRMGKVGPSSNFLGCEHIVKERGPRQLPEIPFVLMSGIRRRL